MLVLERTLHRFCSLHVIFGGPAPQRMLCSTSTRLLYSVLHVRLESKSHENLFVLVMCDFSFLGVTALNVDYASELDLSSLLA
jgi:hypothetical protein